MLMLETPLCMQVGADKDGVTGLYRLMLAEAREMRLSEQCIVLCGAFASLCPGEKAAMLPRHLSRRRCSPCNLADSLVLVGLILQQHTAQRQYRFQMA